MYQDKEIGKIDEERLYGQLLESKSGDGEFCANLDWFFSKALDSEDGIHGMWCVYRDLIGRVGRDTFGFDLSWNTESESIEPSFQRVFCEGFHEKLLQLMLGAKNLLAEVKGESYTDKCSRMHDLCLEFYGIIYSYTNYGVDADKIANSIKWSYLERVDSIFQKAYSIVEYEALPRKEKNVIQQEKAEIKKQIYELFEKPTLGRKIKKIFRKIFKREDNWFDDLFNK